MRSILWALAALTTLAACSTDSPVAPGARLPDGPSMAAGADCKNVSGAVVANFVNDYQIEGTISGDIAGEAFATVKSLTPSRNGKAVEVEFTHQYVTPQGEIYTSDVGTLRPIEEPIDGHWGWYSFDNRLTVAGGTGAYAGATGTMRATGMINPTILASAAYDPGGVQLTYQGRVCVPTASAPMVTP